MKIAPVNNDKKHRRITLVCEDEQATVFCPVSVIEEMQLKEGDEVDEEYLRTRAAQGEKRLAMDIAFRKLSVSAKSERELKNSLYEKRVTRAAVEDTLDKLKGYSLVDDEAYATQYIDTYGRKQGRVKMEYVLTVEKGVDRETVRRLLDERYDFETELAGALAVATKYYTARIRDGKNPKQKLYAFLSGRGFSAEVVRRAITSVTGDDED